MTEFQIKRPDACIAGTRADGATFSHRPGAIVMDFVVRDDREEEPTLLVVQRIMLDPSAAHNVLVALTQRLDAYEREHGGPASGSASSPGSGT